MAVSAVARQRSTLSVLKKQNQKKTENKINSQKPTISPQNKDYCIRKVIIYCKSLGVLIFYSYIFTVKTVRFETEK